MAIETLPSGLKIGFRKWKFGDMERWAELAESGAVDTDVMAEACVLTCERILDPGPYRFLKTDATTLDPSRLLKVDLMWWLYRIRAASHPTNEETKTNGDHYVFDWECSRNKAHRPRPRMMRLTRYDPATKLGLKVRDLPPASVDHVATGKPLAVTLSNGDVVEYRLPVVGMDRLLHEEMKRRTKAARKNDPRAPEVKARQSDAIACQIVGVKSLGANASFEKRAAFIQGLDTDLFGELTTAMIHAAPAINTKFDCYCDECGGKTVVALPLTPGFFLPEVKIWDDEEEEAKTPADTETPNPDEENGTLVL